MWPLAKTIWTIWTFVGRVMSLLFNTLSRFVISFLPRSSHLLISWLQWFWSPGRGNLSLFPPFPFYLLSLQTKLVEVMEFQLSYFKSWKMMLWKCCTQYASKFGKLSSGHRTGKGPFSFHSHTSNYCTFALIWHASKVMLKILQARLRQYVKRELPDVQAGFRKGRGTRDHIENIGWIMEKAREFQKNIYFCFIDYAKAFDCVDHNKLWKILQEMGIPDHLTCLLRNLYTGQEATVRTGHGTTDWFQIGKGVLQGCILSPCLFNLYAEYIMRNAGLEETQAGIKIARRNINNLRYADNTTLMAESEEEWKSLLMKV